MITFKRLTLGLIIFSLGAGTNLAGAAQASPQGLDTRDWGRVLGGVYDAQTGQPLEGASIVIQQQGVFAAEGRTTGKTNQSGSYRGEAVLGRKTSKVDFGRLMNTGLIGLLAGGANKQTKRVDVTQLNLRVSKEGYQTFEGPVPCQAISGEQFTLYLEPILVSPADNRESSSVVKGWSPIWIKTTIAEPAVLAPGGAATLTVWVQCPPVRKPADIKVECESEAFGKTRLKLQEGASGHGAYVFSGQVKINRKAKTKAEFITVSAQAPDNLGGAQSLAMRLHIAKTPEERKVAELRAEAIPLLEANDNVKAVQLLKAACALPQATDWDWALLSNLSLKLHDYETAVAAQRKVMSLVPAKDFQSARATYAVILLEAQDYEQILEELLPQVTVVKEKDRPKQVPIEVMLAIGTAYVKTGKLEEADKISENLRRWPGGDTSQINQFYRTLRLAKVEKAVATNPQQASGWADYGRALMDLGRWEEAVEKLQKALALDPQMAAVQWDLGYAYLQIGNQAPVQQNFELALAEAEKEAATKPEDSKQKQTKDFYAWHRLGLLLYRKGLQQQEAGDPAAPETFARSREMLLEALRCGRTGADENQGVYNFTLGYLSPQIIAVCGFAYPEADADFRLLQGLETLTQQPEDYLTNYNIAVALIDLGQWDLAAQALDKTRQLRPEFLEAKYSAALVARQNGEGDGAIALLREVVAANPRQAQANQALAEIYTEQGDMTAAAACLATQAKYYGHE